MKNQTVVSMSKFVGKSLGPGDPGRYV